MSETGLYSVGQSVISTRENYYFILEYLGKGGNAYAYKVLCTKGINSGMTFALKVQYNLYDNKRRERFEQESAFLKNISHPAILPIFDEGIYESLHSKQIYPFIVTKYMQQTLEKRLRDNIDFEQKVSYACQLLCAISQLQLQNTIHRDIKPTNIFVDDNNVVLGDFGLIKNLTNITDDIEDDIEMIKNLGISDDDLIEGYTAMAKYYRTPELVNYANKKGPLRLESDIFQSGLVLCELFAGINPLLPSNDIHSEIIMRKIPFVDGGKFGKTVHTILNEMTCIDYKKRPTIEALIQRFSFIYQVLEKEKSTSKVTMAK